MSSLSTPPRSHFSPKPTMFHRLLLAPIAVGLSSASTPGALAADIWRQENLVAWCIVPFDAMKRDSEARAQMLARLGLRRLAYDWRAEHVPTFDAEVTAMKRHGIEIVAWWFPTQLDANAARILDVIARHRIHPQLWVMGGGGGSTTRTPAEQASRIESELTRLRAIVDAGAKQGCTIGLYNHGNWFGEPENQLALVERLKREGRTNVGIVYNFHHGHDHLGRFAEFWPRIQPHVLAVNLNGMVAGGDRTNRKLLYLGQGDRELDLMRIIQASGWSGLVGVLNHRTEVDAEEGLRRNLAGLETLKTSLRKGAKYP